MSVNDYDLMPAGLKIPAEAPLLKVKQPGLDEWDGVWGYLQSENGIRALSATPFGRAGLAGRSDKFFFPRLTKASKLRIHMRKGMDTFLENASYRMQEIQPVAYAQSVNTFRNVRQVGLVNNLYKRIHTARDFTFTDLASVKKLSQNDLLDILELSLIHISEPTRPY